MRAVVVAGRFLDWKGWTRCSSEGRRRTGPPALSDSSAYGRHSRDVRTPQQAAPTRTIARRCSVSRSCLSGCFSRPQHVVIKSGISSRADRAESIQRTHDRPRGDSSGSLSHRAAWSPARKNAAPSLLQPAFRGVGAASAAATRVGRRNYARSVRTLSVPRRSSADLGLGHSRHAPTGVISAARITGSRIAAMRTFRA
jgi:hypothetical protein